MDIETKQVRQLAGHVAGALEMVRILLTRHDLGPIARDIVARAEDEIILCRAIVAPAVERANETEAETKRQIEALRGTAIATPVEEKFGTFG